MMDFPPLWVCILVLVLAVIGFVCTGVGLFKLAEHVHVEWLP